MHGDGVGGWGGRLSGTGAWQDWLEAALYLGVHVNQPACLLRGGELPGKASVSLAAAEETRLAS